MRKIVALRQALTGKAYFGLQLAGASWLAWRVLLLAILGEPLDPDELSIFEGLTGRPAPPAGRLASLRCHLAGAAAKAARWASWRPI